MTGYRRSAVVAAATIVSVLALTGCGLPAGVDGHLIDGWAPLAPPELLVPEAGFCHNLEYDETARMGHYYLPVACDQRHQYETVHVGVFPGDTADRVAPPRPGTLPWRTAYQECDEEAAGYLGADRRHGWLWLGVAVPTEPAWGSGARWFRCELLERRVDHQLPVWSGSLRGALAAGPSELLLGCFLAERNGQELDELIEVGCTEPHDSEFMGVWHADGSTYPDSHQIVQGCTPVIVEYVGLRSVDQLPADSRTMWYTIGDADWDNGDRGFRCLVWFPGADLTGSLEGVGAGGLPTP